MTDYPEFTLAAVQAAPVYFEAGSGEAAEWRGLLAGNILGVFHARQ